MQTQIKKWGNSQGIRLSKDILKDAGINENDNLMITASDGKIIIYKQNKRLSLEERAALYGGGLNLVQEIGWPKAEGREVW